MKCNCTDTGAGLCPTHDAAPSPEPITRCPVPGCVVHPPESGPLRPMSEAPARPATRCPTPGCARVSGHEDPCGPITVASARPIEPTIAEAFNTIRQGLWFASPGHPALEALALLERRMGEMEVVLKDLELLGAPVDGEGAPSLRTLAQAFCEDVEASEAAQEAKRRGGQKVPFHGPFCHLQPSARGELNRWARDFREALASRPCWCANPDAECPTHPGGK